MNRHLAGAISSSAGAVANAAARSLIHGTSFGDNLIAALPDVIGSTVGNMLAGGVQSLGGRPGSGNSANAAAAAAEAGNPLVRLGEDKFQITLENGKPFIGNFEEVWANRVDRLREIGIPEAITGNGGSIESIVRFLDGRAALTADPDGTGVLAHDLVRNMVFGVEGAGALGQWAQHFGADATARHIISELPADDATHDYLRPLAQLLALGATQRPAYVGELTRISTLLSAAHQPAAIVTAIRAPEQPRARSELGQLVDANYRVAHLNPRGGSGETGASIGLMFLDYAARRQEGASGREALIQLGTIGVAAAVSRGRGRRPADNVTSSVPGSAPHGNSLRYVGDTHVYVIRGPDGRIHKVGESMQGLRARDGASIRAEVQARALQRERGGFYETEVLRHFPDKASARAYETRLIERYRRLYGPDTLPGNLNNR